jgi:hypothetical protein
VSDFQNLKACIPRSWHFFSTSKGSVKPEMFSGTVASSCGDFLFSALVPQMEHTPARSENSNIEVHISLSSKCFLCELKSCISNHEHFFQIQYNKHL